jgi:hypothetical protein
MRPIEVCCAPGAAAAAALGAPATPGEALRAYRPVQAAARRLLPKISVATAKSTCPVATATAAPVQPPPAQR